MKKRTDSLVIANEGKPLSPYHAAICKTLYDRFLAGHTTKREFKQAISYFNIPVILESDLPY